MKKLTDIKVGVIAEGCNLHIGEVTAVNTDNGDVTIKSMFNGVEYNCDLYHCGIRAQTPEQIEQKQKLFNEGGMKAIETLWDERCASGVY